MKKISLFLLCFFSISAMTFSQVGINTTTPDANADLTLGSTNKGFLPNRVALESTTSVSPLTGTVVEGTIVYNTTDNDVLGSGLYYWTGAQWIRCTTSTAKQQDSQLLTFKQTGQAASEQLPLTYDNTGNLLGTEITSLATSFSVDKPGSIFVLSVLYAKLYIATTTATSLGIRYAYPGNTFFRVRVTKASDGTIMNDFIAGCTPISTAQPTGQYIGANNNPAVAVAQGNLRVEPNTTYNVKVYGLEGWVTPDQGTVYGGTYMWQNFKLYSSVKIDFVSDAY